MLRTTLQRVVRPHSHILTLRAAYSTANSINKTQLPFKHSTEGPNVIKYTKDHEWVTVHKDRIGFLGITQYAAKALGDATYVELPELDTHLEVGGSVGSVESVKSASEVYMPVDGTVVGVNEKLVDQPQLINSDPMGAGWLIKFKLLDDSEKQLDKLMSLEQYEDFLKKDEN